MKKILSLVLAVLMLASLAISTSAVKILNSEGTGFIKTENPLSVKNWELYAMLGGNYPYGGPVYINGEVAYTWWYNDCPDCDDNLAFYYINGNTVYYNCLDDACTQKGVWYTAPQTDVNGIYSGKTCTTCKSDKTIYLETVYNYAGALRDRYFCTACREDFYLAHVDTSIPSYGSSDVPREINCPADGCEKKGIFSKYVVEGTKIYARYVCANAHTTDRQVSLSEIGKGDYTLRVLCSVGGSYRIVGGSSANYGETKTVIFYPVRGYALTEVYVNGQQASLEADGKTLKVTVKSNTVIRAYFEKESNLKNYTITTDVEGYGYVLATKNTKTVSADSVQVNAIETLTLDFIGATKNYRVAALYIDGKSVGAKSSYTFENVRANHTVEVVFEWDNPFTDVAKKYEKAVEYVNELGIIDPSSTGASATRFSGSKSVTVKTFAASLAEMADTNDALDTTAERIRWAEKYGLIDEDTDLNAICDVQTACALVRTFLEALEEINRISFVDLKYLDTVEETAIAINMVSAKTYEKNRNLNRYDLAAVCYLISRLEYID